MPQLVLASWASLTLSTVHTLRVRALNNHIDVWVDGTSVVSLVTSNPSSIEGPWTCAMFGGDHDLTSAPTGVAGHWEAGTYFDDVSISSPGASSAYTGCDTVTDSFNRADAGDGTLGIADSGQQWVSMPYPTYAYVESPPSATFAAGGTWTTQGGTPNTAQAIFPIGGNYYIPFTLLDVHGNNQDITVSGRAVHPDTLRIRFRASSDYHYGYEAVFNPYSPSQLFLFAPARWTVGSVSLA